jgi:hypothetical protein
VPLIFSISLRAEKEATPHNKLEEAEPEEGAEMEAA